MSETGTPAPSDAQTIDELNSVLWLLRNVGLSPAATAMVDDTGSDENGQATPLAQTDEEHQNQIEDRAARAVAAAITRLGGTPDPE